MVGKNAAVRKDCVDDLRAWERICRGLDGPFTRMPDRCLECEGLKGGVVMREGDWATWCASDWKALEDRRADERIKARTVKLRDGMGRPRGKTVLSENQLSIDDMEE